MTLPVPDKDAARPAVPSVKTYFHEYSSTFTHVIRDPDSEHAAIIDPVLDYEPNSARTTTTSADTVIEYVQENSLKVDWILETHAHADHLSAAQHVRKQVYAPVAIGENICVVQRLFRKMFNLGNALVTDGCQFDALFADGESFSIGGLTGHIMHTPGHTPACVTYCIGDAAFVGDTLFMPDYGTARADFPGGDAGTLYQSIQKILALPGDTRLFMCHDYPGDKREPQWLSSVTEQQQKNIHVHDGISENDFVKMREARDQTLDMPRLLLPSIQVNMRAGCLPEPEDNGVSYLRIPVNVLR